MFLDLSPDYDPFVGMDYAPPEEIDWDEEAHYSDQDVEEFINLALSQFVETTVLMPNESVGTGDGEEAHRLLLPFDFSERQYLRKIYDTPAKRRLLMAGRQVEKSTLLGNVQLGLACVIPHLKCLYVSPSSTQTKEFSKSRLKEIIETSPDLRVWFPSDMTDNVFEKKAINRSSIILRYAFLNADRVRGIRADLITIDEFQDILLDNIPVIEEAASHSPFKWFIYSGTPKSLDNAIQHYWVTYSTRNEWAVPCEHHGLPNNPGSWHWNILGERNIGKKALICDKCGKPISPTHPRAQWVATGTPAPGVQPFEGFRIPQLMVPWVSHEEILHKYTSYSRAQFMNEVLGQSFDSGQRPLTQSDVMANCDPDMLLEPDYVRELRKRLSGAKVYAGIDWGQDSSNSYTVICLGAYLDGFFRVFFWHRFTHAEAEPKEQLRKVAKFIESFNIHRVGVDYGGGHWPNDLLLRKYGSQRIVRYQYLMPRKILVFDSQLGRFIAHRTEVMSAVFSAIKRRTVFRFPKWKQFRDPFAKDMLAIHSEYSERARTTIYDKSPNTTDDSFHALVFCFLASMIDHPRPDILIPSLRTDRRLAKYGED